MEKNEAIFTDNDVEKIKEVAEKVVQNPESAIEVVASSDEFRRLDTALELYNDELSSKSRTAKLRLQYLMYVDMIKLYIRAERTENWSLHLIAVRKMLNLFAATAQLTMPKMLDCTSRACSSYRSSIHGYTIIFTWLPHCPMQRSILVRSIRTDSIIEQVLMRSLKSRGGLTRGRGVTETVRVMWLNSMHRCAGVHNAMSNLTGAQHKTSEQHIELGKGRVKKDNEDLMKLLTWFQIHDPFDINLGTLRSISSGITASEEDGININGEQHKKIKI